MNATPIHSYTVAVWLPGRLLDHTTGARAQSEPCPALLTSEQAARYLCLDQPGVVDPERILRDIRAREGIPAITLSRTLHFQRTDLDKWLEKAKK